MLGKDVQDKPGAIPVPPTPRVSVTTPRKSQHVTPDERPTTATVERGENFSDLAQQLPQEGLTRVGSRELLGTPKYTAHHPIETGSDTVTEQSSSTTTRTTPDRSLFPASVGPSQRYAQSAHARDSSTCSKLSYYPPDKSSRPKIFLFVNPSSGGNAAAAFTNAGLQHADLTSPDAELFIADIRDGASACKPAFLQLKDAVEDLKIAKNTVEDSDTNIFLVMAGGDGTVLWGISELWEHLIDDQHIAIAVVPYGTGNDFANALGWNAFNSLNPFSADLKMLKVLIDEWIQAPIILHDIWNIDITVKPCGKFSHIDSKTRQKVVLKEPNSENDLKVLKKKMSNYFSFGIESRIGIGFDRHRTSGAFRNKIVYVNEGLKKTLLHHSIKVDKIVDRMTTTESGSEEIVFSTNPKSGRQLFKCGSLIASNIPSFAAGLDIWKNATRLGLRGKEVSDNIDLKKMMMSPQMLGDGKLEWISFSGLTALGTEQIIEGLGKRIHQGSGKYTIYFKDDIAKEHRVYFQIDGEYYQMTSPLKIEISMFRKVRCLANSKNSRVIRKLDSA